MEDPSDGTNGSQIPACPNCGSHALALSDARSGDDVSPMVVIPPLAITIALTVASVGGVSALHLFIWLSFLYPNTLQNVMIPLLLAPLATYLANKYGKRKEPG